MPSTHAHDALWCAVRRSLAPRWVPWQPEPGQPFALDAIDPGAKPFSTGSKAEDKAAAEEAAKKEAEEAKKKEEQETALAEAQAAEEAKGKQPAGNYKVGTDIDAGTYLIVADGGMTYYQLAKDSTGELTSIITNDNIIGHAILTMNDGEYLTVSSGWFMPLDKVSDELKPKSGYYVEGMYRVGTDIPAGEYQIEPTSGMGYFEITKGTRGNLMDIVTNNNIESPTYVTISDGQILKMNGTQIKVK